MTISEKLTAISNRQVEVYEAGKASGGGGMSDFWDLYQDYGNRKDYQNAFGGDGWNDETFKPKYLVKPSNAYMIFSRSKLTHLENVDFTELMGGQYMFYNCQTIEEVGVISARTTLYGAFQNAFALHTVEEIILPEVQNDGNFFDVAFSKAENLQNVKFSGGKIQHNIDVHWSTLLTAESLGNIVESLSDDVTGKKATFPTTAEATYNAKYGDGAWATLLSTKQNWSIAYA